ELRAEPAAGVERPQRLEGQILDAAAARRGAVDGGVVHQDDVAVPREPDVDLGQGRAGPPRRLERGEGVLRGVRGRAAVGGDVGGAPAAAQANSPGATSGMGTRPVRRRGPAPRLRAASIRSWGTASNVAVMIRIMNGSTTTVWTRITPASVCSSPSRMNIEPRPVAITIPGMMIGASTRNSIARRNGTSRRPSA